jgi:uncharacterized protein
VDATQQLLVWQIDETAGMDTAWATIGDGRLVADGRAAGQRPYPWWTSYRVETGDDYVTARVQMESRWSDGAATLELVRDPDTGWAVNGEPRPDLVDALDCDIGACPLTNTMPVLRHRLLERPGDHHFLMAFIEVPSLRVVPSRQRYTHVRPGGPDGAVITYRSGSFRSDLVFDREGFVLDYPKLGRRFEPARRDESIRTSGPGSARPG